MIIEMLLDVLYSVFNLLTTPIDLPNFTTTSLNYFESFMSYISSGVAIVSTFVDFKYLSAALLFVIAIEVGMYLYQFVLWILKKIPMLGIE